MLYENHICKLCSQNFTAMQMEHMQSNLTGANISVIMPLRAMFVKNQQMTMQFANETYKEFIVKGICNQSNYQSMYEVLATYGVTMSNFFIAISKESGKSALYTSSYTLLRVLAVKGLLIQKEATIPLAAELDRVSELLGTPEMLRKTIQANKNQIVSVRLDAAKEAGTVRFTMSIPRKKLVIGEDIIVPLQSVTTAMDYLQRILQDKILRITSGDKVRYATFNYQVLSAIYGEVRATYLVNQLYDARINQFYVPSLGASVYSSGLTNINIFLVDKIDLMPSLKGVDLSEIYLDKSISKKYLREKIFAISEEDLLRLVAVVNPTGTYQSRGGCIEAIMSWLDTASDDDVYSVIKGGTMAFLSMQELINTPSKYGNMYEQEKVPDNLKDFYKLMNTGVFRLIVESRKGKNASVTCTNSEKELTRIYGEGYIKQYESEGVRLRAVKSSIISGIKKGYSLTDLNKISFDYRVHLDIDVEDAFGLKDIYPKDDILAVLIAKEQQVLERTTVIKQNDLATVRMCDAFVNGGGYAVNYYSQIDLNSVRSIIRLSNV